MTTYDDFLLLLKEEIQKTLGEEFKVEHKSFVKNNGIKLDGMIISRGEDNCVVPNIYVNNYYLPYENGMSIESIASAIISAYQEMKPEGVTCPDDFLEDFEESKYRIVLRLVNYEKNKELLQDLIHIRLHDLALTFHYLVKNDEDGIATIRLTKSFLEKWDKTENELLSIALSNMMRLFPPVLKPIQDVLSDLINEEQEDYDFDEITEDSTDCRMYVLTNCKNINGAVSVFYPDILNKIHEIMETDFYVLPSSIHEFIVVPVRENTEDEHRQLKAMVSEINRTQVAAEEVLSDNIYYSEGHSLSRV